MLTNNNLQTPDEEEFNFEEDDPEFKEKLKNFEAEILDEREELDKVLNNNMQKEKYKNLAIMPTTTSDLNKYIKHPE